MYKYEYITVPIFPSRVICGKLVRRTNDHGVIRMIKAYFRLPAVSPLKKEARFITNCVSWSSIDNVLLPIALGVSSSSYIICPIIHDDFDIDP